MMEKDLYSPIHNRSQNAWLEQLALDEVNMEETGIINFHKINPEKMLEEASISIMEDIKDIFENYCAKFNEFRANYGSEQNIRLFKISDTVNDFMLFRNSLKLIVARKSADIISIGFLSNSGGLRAAKLGNELNDHKVHDIRGHLGPFGHISWKFQGEDIHFPSLAKHYMTEFVQLSAK